MLEFFKNKLEGFSFSTKNNTAQAVIYRPNDSFENMTAADSAKIAISLAINPYTLHGVKEPGGVYLPANAWKRLPEEVRGYFSPEVIELEFC